MKRSRLGVSGPPRAEAPLPAAPLTAEQQGWVERGMKTVARCAKKHMRDATRPGRAAVTYEELLSLGSIGVMQAVRTFDPKKGTDFEVYCYKRVDGAMRYGLQKERQFYAALWEAGYTHLEATRDDGPSLDATDPAADEHALHAFSDRLLGALARAVCGSATMMDAATSEESVHRRAEWSRRMRVLVEEMEQTAEPGKQLLGHLYDEGLTLHDSAARLGLTYGAARRLHERALDDLGSRVRRRCTFGEPD